MKVKVLEDINKYVKKEKVIEVTRAFYIKNSDKLDSLVDGFLTESKYNQDDFENEFKEEIE